MKKSLYVLYILISLFICIGCSVQRSTYLYKRTPNPELIIDSIAKADGLYISNYTDWKWEVMTVTNDSNITKQYMKVFNNKKYLHIINVITNKNDTVLKYKKERK